MRRFMRTVVPTKDYKEVKKIGEKYIVHLDPVEDAKTEATTCYECMVEGEPDLDVLRADLAEYKAYIAERELQSVKGEKIKQLVEYDASSEVNSFTYQDVDMWLDKATRSGLLMRFTAEQAMGKTTTTLWYGTESFELPIENAFGMLYALENYASACYDRTAAHKAAVEALTSVEEVEGYDFRQDYPDKLHF